MEFPEYLTIREAARELGLTPQAVRSRARYRHVELKMDEGPHGTRYLIHRPDLTRLQDETVPQDGSAQPTEPSLFSDETVSRNRSPLRHDTAPSDDETAPQDGSAPNYETVPLRAHLETLKMLQKSQESLDLSQRQTQMLLEETRRIERQTQSMHWELNSYRRALTENAESLAQKSASQDQAQRELEQAEGQRAALEQENLRLRERFEEEKAELAEGLRLSQTRVAWLEKRVPGWLRKVLGA